MYYKTIQKWGLVYGCWGFPLANALWFYCITWWRHWLTARPWNKWNPSFSLLEPYFHVIYWELTFLFRSLLTTKNRTNKKVLDGFCIILFLNRSKFQEFQAWNIFSTNKQLHCNKEKHINCILTFHWPFLAFREKDLHFGIFRDFSTATLQSNVSKNSLSLTEKQTSAQFFFTFFNFIITHVK